MDTNALKKFAQAARNLLIDQVGSKLELVLDPASPSRREHPLAMRDLDSAIVKLGKVQVVEQVAYTWFNRFTALRFMDANGYTTAGIVSPGEGQTRPEVLAEAMAGNLPDSAPASISALLDGRTPSPDPQAEAYRQLLVLTCNEWHKPMPFLFEELDDYTELLMPEDLLSQNSILAEMRKVMTEDACRDVEIIGWLYQFYISEKKDQVFAGLKKNQKITAENIPAATQLFTPHWIVRYLVENSLGRLWLLNRPQSRLADQMDYYIAPEEPETDFLKITKPEDIRICDPAAGSGHMLTYAFDLLYAIYEEEGYDATEIPTLILTNNLTGVEIDDRAGALGAFALAMKAAAKLGRRRFLRMDVTPDICVLQNVSFTDAEMQDVAAVVGKDLFTDDLRETLGQFEQAKNFGSLIVPKLRDPAEALRVVKARDFGGDLLLKDVQARVVAVLRMAEALSPKHQVVVANPPYMGAGGMNPSLKAFIASEYKDYSNDLYNAFIYRISLLSIAECGLMTPFTWIALSTFENLRRHIIGENTIRSLVKPQYHTMFDSAAVPICAFCFSTTKNTGGSGVFFDLEQFKKRGDQPIKLLEGIDKPNVSWRYDMPSKNFLNLPSCTIAFNASQEILSAFSNGAPLGEQASIGKGLDTGDNGRFLRLWYETPINSTKWFPCQKGGQFRKWYGNNEFVIDWEHDGASLKNFPKANLRNQKNYFKEGLTWTRISSAVTAFRYFPSGHIFESTGPCYFPSSGKPSDSLGFLNSQVARQILTFLAPTMDFQSGHISGLPSTRNDTSRSGATVEECIGIAKIDWDAYETSWDFTTLPLLQPDHRAETLEATYTTLRTHWQGMTDEMLALEEENNRIFIDAYGLQDELTPEVPLNEITLTCNPAYRYGIKNDAEANETRLRADTMAEFLSYAVGCMFGRYSLDAPGIILANQGETLADYLARIPEPSFMPDKDNVIPVLDADWFPDDITDRFRLFLRTTFGEVHFRENLRYIEDALGKDIRKYFTKDFYADHVKRYKKRPIYWMFSSPKGSFNALIYMHRYQSDTISVLLNDYLREFISKLEGERGRLEKLSDDPSANPGQSTKALKDMAVIAKQIDELNEWERDVVFPLAQAKIEIDLDDGVKANYPKFGDALKKIVGVS